MSTGALIDCTAWERSDNSRDALYQLYPQVPKCHFLTSSNLTLCLSRLVASFAPYTFPDINKLTGTLPTEFGKWTDIQGFYMGKISKPLHVDTRRVQSVADYLYYDLSPPAKNQLTGTIPTEAGRMTSLVKINVIENDLTGTIPTEIGMVSHPVCYDCLMVPQNC